MDLIDYPVAVELKIVEFVIRFSSQAQLYNTPDFKLCEDFSNLSPTLPGLLVIRKKKRFQTYFPRFD
jgi:hypothetical protein